VDIGQLFGEGKGELSCRLLNSCFLINKRCIKQGTQKVDGLSSCRKYILL